MPLLEVDRVEILTLLDLSLDLLMAGSETVRRVDIAGTIGEGRSTLRAEHGFSSLVTVVQGDRRASTPLLDRDKEGLRTLAPP